MLNQLILVGRLVDQPKMEGENVEITIAVPRPFKNEEGEYETDFISCKVNGTIATNTCEYCHKGDVIGIKGRLQMKDTLEIMVEKITFLSSRSQEIEKEMKESK